MNINIPIFFQCNCWLALNFFLYSLIRGSLAVWEGCEECYGYKFININTLVSRRSGSRSALLRGASRAVVVVGINEAKLFTYQTLLSFSYFFFLSTSFYGCSVVLDENLYCMLCCPIWKKGGQNGRPGRFDGPRPFLVPKCHVTWCTSKKVATPPNNVLHILYS